MLQHEHLARELVEAINEGSSAMVTLTEQLDVELTEIFKQRSEHAREIKLAHLIWNTEELQVDQEPIVVIADGAVWISAFVRVPTDHTDHTDFGAIE